MQSRHGLSLVVESANILGGVDIDVLLDSVKMVSIGSVFDNPISVLRTYHAIMLAHK
jgi:hypothetical protein